MPKRDEFPAWYKRIGIDKTCRLVAMYGGCVVLTKTDDGVHTLWLYDYPIMTGDAASVRNRYADHMPGDWLEKYYRSPA